MNGDFKFIMSIIFGLVLSILILLYGVISPIGYLFCQGYGTASEREVKFHYWSGYCYVKHDNQWYLKDEFKNLIIASGLKEK